MSRILEGAWTSQFLKKLRQAIPEAEIVKLNSYGGMSEGGLPDFFVSRFDMGPYSRTVFCEVKLLPASGPLFKPLQVARLKRLGGWMLIWDTNVRRGWLFPVKESEGWSNGTRYTQKELIERIARFF